MKWNLNDIKASANIEKNINKFESLLKTLSPKMTDEEFRKVILESESLAEEISKINYLPELKEAVDQNDAEAKKQKAQARELYLKYAKVVRPLDHWIKGLDTDGLKKLDNKNAKRLFGAVKDLEYSLNRSRELAKYSLDLKSEEIISNKDTFGMEPLLDLREMIETENSYELRVNSKKFKIETLTEVTKLFHDKDRKVRKAAYVALLNRNKDNLNKYNLVYQARVRDWTFEGKLRGYKSPISERNIGNDVSDKTIETMMEVCKENKGIFQKFFKLKAKKIGLKKLERWDVYAPAELKEKSFDWQETKKIVLESFDKFWPEFGKKAKQIIDEEHVDLMPKKGKRGGAFCATVTPKISPYVLLNFTGTQRDILVAAHELGHGVHSLMANEHLPSTQHAPLPLAETASTLGELIVFNQLLNNEKDPELKKSLIWEKLGDAYATILRQNYFVMFEMEAFEAIGKGVTGEELSDIYLKNLKEQFGDSVEVDEKFRYEWAYISHIFETPFYCYAYNFGELLSYGLYQRYLKEGETFILKIKKILTAGGSENPTKLLKGVGIDIEDKLFWNESFEVIKKWIAEIDG